MRSIIDYAIQNKKGLFLNSKKKWTMRPEHFDTYLEASEALKGLRSGFIVERAIEYTLTDNVVSSEINYFKFGN